MKRPSDRIRSAFWVPLTVFGAWLFFMTWHGDFRVLLRQWPTVLTMALGSLSGGGTCQGGSAVAFPVFTKVLHLKAEFARTFGFAVQSIGMTTASGFIVARRISYYGPVVLLGVVAGIPGLLLGTWFLAPLLQGEAIRICFTCMQVTFIAALVRTYVFAPPLPGPINTGARARAFRMYLPLFCFLGGALSSLATTGIGVLLYAALAIGLRAEERSATATSVMVTAAISIVGIATAAVRHEVTSKLTEMWLASIPVVAFGAPLGAWVCSRMSRRAILYVLVALVSVEAITTFTMIPISLANHPVYAISIISWLPVYALLIHAGGRCGTLLEPFSTLRNNEHVTHQT